MVAAGRVLAVLTVLALASVGAADPYPVGTTPSGPWITWGYGVDGQAWANWFVVDIPWSTDAAMSGTWLVQQDFLFRVDPATSGSTNPANPYAQSFWNHDGVPGLGEFFDAGIQSSDRNYYLTLSLSGGTGTWALFYDGNRNQLADQPGDHAILAGAVLAYFNRDGKFYGILQDADGKYDGYFIDAQNEGNPNLINGVFHAGFGDPVPEPASLLVWSVLGLVGGAYGLRRLRRR